MTQVTEDRSEHYIPCNQSDEVYFGAADVVTQELEHIKKRRQKVLQNSDAAAFQEHRVHWEDPTLPIENVSDSLAGLALSGGGIRSASFSLGVLQALAYADWLKRIDYLSTVSGGGYIGSSLTWLLSHKWKVAAASKKTDAGTQPAAPSQEELNFGVRRENFPLSSYPIATDSDRENQRRTLFGSYSGYLLRYLRQHGRYLTPGAGIDAFSGVAVLLRNTLFSLLFNGSILVLLFCVLGVSHLIPLSCENQACMWGPNQAPELFNLYSGAGIVMSLWLACAAIYVAVTRAFGSKELRFFHRLGVGGESNTGHTFRRAYESRWGRYPLIAALTLLILGSVPLVYGSLQALGTPVDAWQASSSVNILTWLQEKLDLIAGIATSISGIVTTLLAFRKSSKTDEKGLSPAAWARISSVLLLFGTLLLTFAVYLSAFNSPILVFVSIAVILILGTIGNINYLSLHRYYRDRLMETYLPDVGSVIARADLSKERTHDKQQPVVDPDSSEYGLLANMCGMELTEGADPGPYHLINTNLVLASSNTPKYRGRGGDNYILSPLFSGSNATGWCKTGKRNGDRVKDGMSLATAMAISGAALNSNTGSGGIGITRQPLLSMLMAMLNIRLGYWTLNPMPDPQRLQRIRKRYALNSSGKPWIRQLGWYLHRLPRVSEAPPNAWYPAMAEFTGRYLQEDSRWLQLSDGGHFENLGMYELIRRRVKLLLVCDGSEDSKYSFSDLANVMERARADFGARIDIDSEDLQDLVPKSDGKDEDMPKFAKRGFLMAKIHYADSPDKAANREGVLVYMTTTFFKELSADLAAYRKLNSDFPDQSTTDQFFDELQFEAYRELGYQTACQMMLSDEARKFGVTDAFGQPQLSKLSKDSWHHRHEMDHDINIKIHI